MDAGMLRLVFGLGTRAVDRVNNDYVRIVALDDPTRLPAMTMKDPQKFSQHYVDVLKLNKDFSDGEKLFITNISKEQR